MKNRNVPALEFPSQDLHPLLHLGNQARPIKQNNKKKKVSKTVLSHTV